MNYTTRPGVALVTVCGVKLLIADRKASEFCPQPLRLKISGAVIWGFLEKGRMEDIDTFYSILSKKSPEEVREKVDGFLHDLCEKGFLIAGERE